MIAVDGSVLRALAPTESGGRAEHQAAIIDGIGSALASTLQSYAINTPLRVAHFLAQIAHESDGFCTTEEYADGRAYDGRLDLGNVQPGDGPRYKGRGLIQLTGRMNYAATGKELALDLVDNPLSVNDPITYLLVACAFWTRIAINPHCDADDLYAVTRLVNGGLNGLDSRRVYLARAKVLLAPLAAEAEGAVPGKDQPVLWLGNTGDAVARLQQDLAAKGYPLAKDGNFGPATATALRHFEATHDLPPDGIVTATVWHALS